MARTVHARPPRPRPLPPAALVARHPLAAYLILTFALSWAVMVPLAADARGLIRFDPPLPLLLPLVLIMAYGPSLAAIAVTGAVEGRAGVRALVGRLLRWRAGPRWYAVALGLPAVWLLAGAALHATAGGAASLPALGPGLLMAFAGQVLAHGAVNGEELGWRGFALPRLQDRHGALAASLILGVMWALFHLPIFFMQGSNIAGSQDSMPFHGFLLSTIALAVLFTWLFNNTRGSVLLAIFFHAATNAWTEILRAPTSGPLYWLQLGVLCAFAAAVAMSFPPARIARRNASTARRPASIPS